MSSAAQVLNTPTATTFTPGLRPAIALGHNGLSQSLLRAAGIQTILNRDAELPAIDEPGSKSHKKKIKFEEYLKKKKTGGSAPYHDNITGSGSEKEADGEASSSIEKCSGGVSSDIGQMSRKRTFDSFEPIESDDATNKRAKFHEEKSQEYNKQSMDNCAQTGAHELEQKSKKAFDVIKADAENTTKEREDVVKAVEAEDTSKKGTKVHENKTEEGGHYLMGIGNQPVPHEIGQEKNRTLDVHDSEVAKDSVKKRPETENEKMYERALGVPSSEVVHDEGSCNEEKRKGNKRTLELADPEEGECSTRKRTKIEDENRAKDSETPEEVLHFWAAKLAKNATKPKPTKPKVSGFLAAALRKQFPEKYGQEMGLEAPLASGECVRAREGFGAPPKSGQKNLAGKNNGTETKKAQGGAKDILEGQRKKSETGPTIPNNRSNPKLASTPGFANLKGKRKATDSDESYSSSSKKPKQSTERLEDAMRSSAAGKTVRSKFQASRPKQKTTREELSKATPPAPLRGGKCTHELHAWSTHIQELCQSGELEQIAAAISNSPENKRKREDPEGEKPHDHKRHRQRK